MAHRMVAVGQVHHGKMINGGKRGKFGVAKTKRLAKKKRIKKIMKGRRR
jgi:hypothetical protein